MPPSCPSPSARRPAGRGRRVQQGSPALARPSAWYSPLRSALLVRTRASLILQKSLVSFVNRKSAPQGGKRAITMLGAKTQRQPTKQLRKLREISAQKLCAGTVSFSIDT